ncbi:hypothetical protein LEN26_013814 [Aphanomyces euteiches]|nr:hypothetical protein AeMF1_021231 [Aphanomyces euteiches]KAH9110265.1 hypothetical protein LEN26_013814 [Aphanomyces euteiches]KAH9182098.1 hypothetical protein AeNC1_015924 [Aphanomyces euteiches]
MNVSEGEVFHYPLLLVEGKFHCSWDLPDNVLAEVYVNDVATYWPVSHNGVFKALVLLPTYGQHEICLNIAETYHIVSVEYRPSNRPHRVHFYYQTGKDSEGTFDAPPGVDNSVAAAVKKIQFNAMLLQTAMAVLLAAHGIRETFNLELDDNGQPIVHVLESSFTDEFAYTLSDNQLIDHVEKDLKAQGFLASEFGKHIVILGSSKYDPETKSSKAHTALGGSQVGVFGSCNLHTWASHVGNVTQSFLDSTRIDTNKLSDDSCFRGTYAGNFATGLGAVLHELGHTLGLGHSTHGIMARGFDDMNCLFCTVKPRSDVNGPTFTNAFPDGKLFLNYSNVVNITSAEGAHWHRASALKLQRSPWLSERSRQPSALPSITWRGKVAGPVGCGSGVQEVFGTDSKDVAAFLIQADSSGVQSIEILTNSALNDLLMCGLAASGSQDLFVLMDGEYITRIDVEETEWVDAIRFHTNYRVSRFFGGFGGQLHVLKAPPNHAFYSIFGSVGSSHVGCVGALSEEIPRSAFALSIPAPTPVGPTTTATSIFDQIGSFFGADSSSSSTSVTGKSGAYAKIGVGIDGTQEDFNTKSIQAIGAIVLTCTDSIVRFRVISRSDFVAEFTKGFYASPNELVFALAAHEVLIQVDVRTSGWIHGLRFHTNARISPWYGGFEGEEHSFVCAPDSCITGFYGSHGPQYLGTLGTFFGPIPNLPRPQQVQSIPPPAVDGAGTIHALSLKSNELILESQLPSPGDGFDTCFLLHKGEALIQLDLLRHEEKVVGLCFHTTSRSSEWYGSSTNGNLEVVLAPKGEAFASLSVSQTGAEYTFAPIAECRVAETSTPPSDVTLDLGEDDISLESDNGVAFIVLCKFNNGDSLVDQVIEFPQQTQSPQTVRLSLAYLKAQVSQPLTDYCIEVVDDSGVSTMSPILPACLT